MKSYSWSNEKNLTLKRTRGVSFEDVLYFINNKRVMAIVEHPNKDKYPEQKMYIIEMNNYAYLVPFIENEHEFFLKTIIPSRKATKKYLENDNEN